ncbi:hypothetical protein ACP4OV_006725 [Aristida adscensionis]
MASGGATLKMATACMLVLLLGQVLIMANPAVAENLFDQVAFWNDVQTIQRGKEMAAQNEASKACVKKCDAEAKNQAEQGGRTAAANVASSAYYSACVKKC